MPHSALKLSISLLFLTAALRPAISAEVVSRSGTGLGPHDVAAQAPAHALPNPEDVVPWPEAGYPHFAPGSVVNANDWLFDAPAGKHGVVTSAGDGTLRFADGSPARFWGTALVYGASFPDKREEVPAFADAIAAYGYNAVRFHHNDVSWRGIGFMKADSNSELDPQGIDDLDYFAAELIKRGIYLYVDLIDSRALVIEDDMPGWESMKDNGGWKGLFPHPAIVAAWKRAATAFLGHTNPYTGRTWAEEPAVIAVEIINENGLFWDWSHKVNPVIHTWYDTAWNSWLTTRYNNRSALAKAWTDADGICGLSDDEDPQQGNVYRPRLVTIEHWDRSNAGKARGACRLNDYYTFLRESMSEFYHDATAHLRELGYQSIVIGSHELQGPTNQIAEVEGTGAIASHLYAMPRMSWGARPGVKGVEVDGVDVKSRNWYANLPRVKVSGVPGINGEWAANSLMERADTNAAVAAISTFQQLPISIHFSLAHRWRGTPMPQHDTTYAWQDWRKAIGNTFTSLHDAPWVMTNRICAAMILRGDLAPAKIRAHIAYSAEDAAESTLHALGLNGGSGTIGGAAQFLPMMHLTESAYFDTVYAGNADVVFTSGRSASGDYRQAKHAVILGDSPWCDRHRQKRDLAAQARIIHPKLRTKDVSEALTFTLSAPWAEPHSLTITNGEGFIETASLPRGATPIGLTADGAYTLGWLDDRFLVLPQARALDELGGDARWLLRLYVWAAQRWNLPIGNTTADNTTYSTDTGEIAIDWASGAQRIDTPRTQGVIGFTGWRSEHRTSNLQCSLDRRYGNVLVTSADGEAISSSRRLLLIACARVMNTGETLTTNAHGGVSIAEVGKAPCLIECLSGEVALTGLTQRELIVYALDPEGRRYGKVPATLANGILTIPLSIRWQTAWFEIADPSIDAPTVERADWPAAEGPTTKPEAAPTSLPTAEFLALLVKPTASETAVDPQLASAEAVTICDPSAAKPFQVYNNAAIASGTLMNKPALTITYGKITKEWSGGVWFPAKVPATVTAGHCQGLRFTFAGDGTLPRESYFTCKVTGGREFRSRNINDIFEDSRERDITLTAADFEMRGKNADKNAVLPFAAIEQIHLSCVGPLMDQQSIARLGSVSVLVAAPRADLVNPDMELPKATVPASATLKIPWLPEAIITADGKLDDAAWKSATAVLMDEQQVPRWQVVGSHVADGTASGQRGRFWLVATPGGLGLIAAVDKAGDPVTAKRGDWWFNDCVELFTDIDADHDVGKPDRQIFLAYAKADADAASASDASITIGRALTAEGYVLESLIPWKALGFSDVPKNVFGIDLQIDFANNEGRKLQMTWATGTNEAWISSKHFVRVELMR